MDIRWLRTFLLAAKCENFRAASEALYISQPTVSVHIKQLEDELQVALFERHGRNVILTEAGRRFVHDATRMVHAHDDQLQQFRNWAQGHTHTLTIGVSPLVASSILPRILSRFTQAYAQIDVVVRVMESPDVETAVAEGSIDVGFSRIPSRMRDITCSTLYDDPVVCVIPHDGRDMDSAPMDLQKVLTTHRVLTNNHPLYWDDLLRDLRRLEPNLQTMVVSQVYITKRFIEEGMGMSFLPISTVRRELMEGRLLAIPTPLLQLPIAHTYVLTSWSVGPVVVRFVNFMESLKPTL